MATGLCGWTTLPFTYWVGKERNFALTLPVCLIGNSCCGWTKQHELTTVRSGDGDLSNILSILFPDIM